jgi:hypothetical protein
MEFISFMWQNPLLFFLKVFQFAQQFKLEIYFYNLWYIFNQTLLSSLNIRLGYWLTPPYCLAQIEYNYSAAVGIYNQIEIERKQQQSLEKWNVFHFLSSQIYNQFQQYCTNSDSKFQDYPQLQIWLEKNYSMIVVHNSGCERGFSILGKFWSQKPRAKMDLASSHLRKKLNNTELTEEEYVDLQALAALMMCHSKVDIQQLMYQESFEDLNEKILEERSDERKKNKIEGYDELSFEGIYIFIKLNNSADLKKLQNIREIVKNDISTTLQTYSHNNATISKLQSNDKVSI